MASSYKLPTGRVIPTETAEHVRAGIRQAMGADSDASDSGFRRHLITRAAVHGMKHMIPASWAHESAGKSAGVSELYKFDVTRVDAVATPANGIGTLLMKSAAAAAPARPGYRSVSVEYDAPALEALGKAPSLNAGLTELARQGRLGELQQDIARTAKAIAASVDEPLSKAAEDERQAAAMTDPVTAEGYRQRARQAREQVTSPAGFLAKAEEYERQSWLVSDPRDREQLRELAKTARQKASMA